MVESQFVADDFIAPETMDTQGFHFRVLEPGIAELDYVAVISSQKRLQGIFGPGSSWPETDLTLEQNIQSLKIHQQEFEQRQAFAYSVFNQSRDKCLGSVYIDPSRAADYDCEVYYWIRDDSLALEQELTETVFHWLLQCWPFNRIAFPGRVIPWHDWEHYIR